MILRHLAAHIAEVDVTYALAAGEASDVLVNLIHPRHFLQRTQAKLQAVRRRIDDVYQAIVFLRTVDQARRAAQLGGEARIVRPGRDLTLVSYGATVATCLQAAKELAAEGAEAEVIDLRSIQPWDRATVLASLARTHRAVVVHEAVTAFGVGAEIAATLSQEGFDDLDAPVLRVGAPFMPVPFASSLESGYAVDAAAVLAAARECLN